jgi:thioredoxin 1
MASEYIVDLSSENFDQEVLKSDTPVLVDFWAEWCGPCKMLAPVLDELATEYGGKIKVGKVNIDNDQQLSVQYGIQSIPTLLVFKDGQVQGQHVGLKSKSVLKEALDTAIG